MQAVRRLSIDLYPGDPALEPVATVNSTQQIVSDVYDELLDQFYEGMAVIEFNDWGEPDTVLKSYSVAGLRRFDAAGVQTTLIQATEVSGPNILEVLSLQYIESTASYEIKQPFCARGSLAILLEDKLKNNEPFGAAEIWRIFAQIVAGLLQLYSSTQTTNLQGGSECIYHGSLTPTNVLFDYDSGNVLLSDYGLYHLRCLFNQQPRYPSFLAPEITGQSANYTEQCDVWALGCLLYSLCVLRPPCFSLRELRRGINIYSRTCPGSIRTLLQKCLEISPDRRPTVLEIAALPVVSAAYPEFFSLLQLSLPRTSLCSTVGNSLLIEDLSDDRHRPSVDIQSMKIHDKVDSQATGVFHSILAAVAEAEADFDFGSDVEITKPPKPPRPATHDVSPHDIYMQGTVDTPPEPMPSERTTPEPQTIRRTATPRSSQSPRRKRQTPSQPRVRSRPRVVFGTQFEMPRPSGTYYQRRRE